MTTTVSTAAGTPQRRFLSLLATLGTAAFLLAPSSASAQVALGTAANFGVLGATPDVNNTGATVVTGAVGVFPAASIIGFPPGTATSLEPGTAVAGQAQTDLGLALAAALGTACGTTLTGDLGNRTLTPGVYCYPASAGLTGDLTLDFQGNPNAVFLFKIGSALTTASASRVLAINTGIPPATCLPNINWYIGSSATLGTGSNFAGNILSEVSITLTSGATLRGRALARTGTVTLAANPAVGGCPIAAAIPGGPIPGVPGSGIGANVTDVPTLQEWNLIFLGLLLAAAGGWYVRRRGLGR